MNPEVSAAIIAVVEAVKRGVPAKFIDFKGAIVIVLAAVLGIAYALYQDADLIQGAVNGLVAAGVVTVASKIGK